MRAEVRNPKEIPGVVEAILKRFHINMSELYRIFSLPNTTVRDYCGGNIRSGTSKVAVYLYYLSEHEFFKPATPDEKKAYAELQANPPQSITDYQEHGKIPEAPPKSARKDEDTVHGKDPPPGPLNLPDEVTADSSEVSHEPMPDGIEPSLWLATLLHGGFQVMNQGPENRFLLTSANFTTICGELTQSEINHVDMVALELTRILGIITQIEDKEERRRIYDSLSPSLKSLGVVAAVIGLEDPVRALDQLEELKENIGGQNDDEQ